MNEAYPTKRDCIWVTTSNGTITVEMDGAFVLLDRTGVMQLKALLDNALVLSDEGEDNVVGDVKSI